MFNRAARNPDNGERRRFRMLPITVAGAAVALFVGLGGSAIAAKGLISAVDIATGAVTSKSIKDGAIKPQDLNRKTKRSLHGAKGARARRATPV